MARTHTTIPMQMLDDGYTMSEALVYSRLWHLANYTDEADCLYPSIEQMGKDLRLSERQVIRALQVLEGYGLLKIDHRGQNKRNNYCITSMDNYPCFCPSKVVI